MRCAAAGDAPVANAAAGLGGSQETAAARTATMSWNEPLRRAIGAHAVRIAPDPDVRIAVIDNGVAAHPALARSLGAAATRGAHGREVLAHSDIDWDVSASQCVGEHATWVAGAIGGEHAGRAIGVFPGVRIDSWSAAPDARDRTCAACTSALQLTAAVRAAADDGARVINLSCRLRGQPLGCELWHETLAYVARKQNVTVVLAAGNAVANLDASWLAQWRRDFPHLLVVTSSERGRVIGGYGARSVPLAVPFDEAMCTTSTRAITAPGCPGIEAACGYGYTRRRETSLATAVVSAAAAMVLSCARYRHASAAEVVRVLLANARRDGLDPAAPIADPGGRLWLGFLAD